MNQPYIKQLNEKGETLNPIQGAYVPEFPTRRERREIKNRKPFRGNKKGISLTIFNNLKYRRVIQWIKGKPVFHYLPC